MILVCAKCHPAVLSGIIVRSQERFASDTILDVMLQWHVVSEAIVRGGGVSEGSNIYLKYKSTTRKFVRMTERQHGSGSWSTYMLFRSIEP